MRSDWRAAYSRFMSATAAERGALATKADLADLKADIFKVAIGIVFANAGLTFALLKLV